MTWSTVSHWHSKIFQRLHIRVGFINSILLVWHFRFFIYLHPLIVNRRVIHLLVPLSSSSTEDQIKTEPKTMFWPSSWKICTEESQTLKLKSSRKIPWTTPTTSWIAELCSQLKGKEVENNDLGTEKWKKQLSGHKTLVFLVTSWGLI